MPVGAAVEAMRRVRALIEANKLHINFILEVPCRPPRTPMSLFTVVSGVVCASLI